MEPSKDFVDNRATVFHREAEIELGEETLPVEIFLSEDGQLNLETSRMGLDTGELETQVSLVVHSDSRDQLLTRSDQNEAAESVESIA